MALLSFSRAIISINHTFAFSLEVSRSVNNSGNIDESIVSVIILTACTQFLVSPFFEASKILCILSSKIEYLKSEGSIELIVLKSGGVIGDLRQFYT